MTQLLILTLVAFGVMALVVAGMAVGVMVTGREIKGSCGGVGGGDCACSKSEREGCPQPGSGVEASVDSAARPH